MMFRDFGDGRCIIYVCPIKPLFSVRTIGHHRVRWEDVLELARFKHVFTAVAGQRVSSPAAALGRAGNEELLGQRIRARSGKDRERERAGGFPTSGGLCAAPP